MPRYVNDVGSTRQRRDWGRGESNSPCTTSSVATVLDYQPIGQTSDPMMATAGFEPAPSRQSGEHAAVSRCPLSSPYAIRVATPARASVTPRCLMPGFPGCQPALLPHRPPCSGRGPSLLRSLSRAETRICTGFRVFPTRLAVVDYAIALGPTSRLTPAFFTGCAGPGLAP